MFLRTGSRFLLVRCCTLVGDGSGYKELILFLVVSGLLMDELQADLFQLGF